MSIALAEKMSASLDDRRARVRELDAIIASCQVAEDEELRSSFRVDTGTRHSATSKLEQIRRKRIKAETEREGLTSDLVTLEDEARKASQSANREQAEKAIADYREFPAAEQAYDRELKAALIDLLATFVDTLPPLWAEMRDHEQKAVGLAAQANMTQDWEHARDQVYNHRTAESFLAHVEAAVRSIKVDDLSGATRAAIQNDPPLLLRFKYAEESPTFTEAKAPAWVWVNTSTAPLISIDAPHGATSRVRQIQDGDGFIHPAIELRRSEPSEAELNEKDPQTGADLWRRMDADLVRRVGG